MTEIIWKATVLLVAALIAQAALARASAALRHFLWTGAFACLLLLPVALRIVPRWRPQAVAVVAAVESAAPVVVHGTAPAPTPIPWLALLWALGCAAAAARFLAGAVRTSRMVRHASDASAAREAAQALRRSLGIRHKVRVLESAGAPMPLAWGILRPVVLLPEGSAAWPEGRLHAVLLHELIHVRRRDLAAQALAQAACCLYWFNPLAWLGLRQQRRERERACDDAVLSAGLAPHDYAAHLVDLVRGMAARRSRWADAPAMAEASGLELRVRDLLRASADRRPLTRKSAMAAAGLMAAVFAPLAAITALAQGPTSGLSGTVKDPSGAVVPGCRVVARNLNGSNQETARCNAAGQYQLASIPAGDYRLEVTTPGFAKWSLPKVTLATGSPAQVDVMLAVGEVSEAMTVQGQGPHPMAMPAAGAPQRIRVGGNVQAVQILNRVPPEYPAELQQAGVQGVVEVRAIIGKDGSVLSPVVVNTVDSRLAQLALDAVKQWGYQPALLNGEPIEVLTTIDIDFTLNPPASKQPRGQPQR